LEYRPREIPIGDSDLAGLRATDGIHLRRELEPAAFVVLAVIADDDVGSFPGAEYEAGGHKRGLALRKIEFCGWSARFSVDT